LCDAPSLAPPATRFSVAFGLFALYESDDGSHGDIITQALVQADRQRLSALAYGGRATNGDPWWGDSAWKTTRNNNTVSPEDLGNSPAK